MNYCSGKNKTVGTKFPLRDNFSFFARFTNLDAQEFIEYSAESRLNNFLYLFSSGFEIIFFYHPRPKAFACNCSPANAIPASISAQYFIFMTLCNNPVQGFFLSIHNRIA